MKQIIEQIKFIDKTILPIFGITSVIDYKNIIYKSDINQEIILQLNNNMTEIKKIFPVRELYLNKTDKITSNAQAYNLLKKCLTITGIYFVEEIHNLKKSVRLTNKNKILEDYIKSTKMSENGNFHSVNTNININNNLHNGLKYGTIAYDTLKNNIKNTKNESYFSKINISNNRIQIKDHFIFHNNIRGLYIKFKNLNEDEPMFTETFLDKLFNGKMYTVEANGGVLYKSIFQNNQNIFPNNIIIPFEIAVYAEIIFYLYLDSEIPQCIIDNLIVYIEVEKITFKKQIEQQLKTCVMDIHINENIIWRFSNGTIALPTESKLKTKPFNFGEYKDNYEFHKIGKYNYTILKENGNFDQDKITLCFYPIMHKYDFSVAKYINNIKSMYVKEIPDWYEFRYIPTRYVDTMYNIFINIPSCVSLDQIDQTEQTFKIFVSFDDNDKNIEKCNWEISLNDKNVNVIKILNYDIYNQLCLQNMTTTSFKIYIHKSTCSSCIINSMYDMEFIYLGALWTQEYKNNIFDKNILIISE